MNDEMTGNYKVKPWFLHFNLLGSYDDYQSNHKTKEEAMKKLERLKSSQAEWIEDYGYFAFIAKVEHCERRSET